jgi:hypothetical protein
MGSGKINFKGCFHDVARGVDTHIRAPMGVDLRHNLRIAGNQPGEPPEPRELGINAPAEGLYLREDIQITCNFTMISFVKAQLKASSKVLVDRLIKKAELLDAGELLAMMENGKLKTINPADRSRAIQQQQQQQPPPLPGFAQSPGIAREPSTRHTYIPYQQGGQGLGVAGQTLELPGDFYHTSIPSASPHLQRPSLFPGDPGSPVSQLSGHSPDVNAARWSDSSRNPNASRPTSYVSDAGGLKSPGVDHKSFPAELPS